MKRHSASIKALLWGTIVVLMTFTIGGPPTVQTAPTLQSAARPGGAATTQPVLEAYGKLPLSFEANQGQTDARVKFLARGSGYTLYLTPTEAVLALRKVQGKPPAVERTQQTDTTVLRMMLVGANPQPRDAC